jgi:hypothetical protein
MHQALEHQEHAQHAAAHGSKHAALIVAVLAALLAVTEQQARHAEIKVNTNSILAADSWDQYQGKSTRQQMSEDLARMAIVMDPATDPAENDKFVALAKQYQDEAQRFAKDPKDGKGAIAERARAFEEARGEALEMAHSFDNAAAAFELGIVLATASAITNSKLLIRFSLLMGAVGIVIGILGLTDPALSAF